MDPYNPFFWLGFASGALLLGGVALRFWHQNTKLKLSLRHETVMHEAMKLAMDDHFSAAAQSALEKNNQSFLALAESKLKEAHLNSTHDMDKRQKAIADLIDPVNKALSAVDTKIQALEKERVSAYADIKQHMHLMGQDQVRLQKETASLVQALRSPATRGQWGEMQLKRCLEMAGMKAGVHYKEQVSVQTNEGNTQRPDVVVNLSGGQSIVIDSKAPIDGYIASLQDNVSESEREAALIKHAKNLKDHIRALGSKSYFEQFDSPEFVVLFLPAESYFAAAVERDPSLIEAGVDQKVILATPTTLISLLKAVMYGWRQEQMTANAKEIAEAGARLHERVSKFVSYMHKVGGALDKAVGVYNEAVGSFERRVLPEARKFEELGATLEHKTIANLDPIDKKTRSVK